MGRDAIAQNGLTVSDQSIFYVRRNPEEGAAGTLGRLPTTRTLGN